MNLKTGVLLLRLLPTRPEHALSTREILRRWLAKDGPAVDLRTIQRYMAELSDDLGDGQNLVAGIQRGPERCFHLRSSQVANWFMTEEAALDLQLSRNVFGRAFGAGEGDVADKMADMAERVVIASPETRRIRERLRIVPDGIGRLPAPIDSAVMRAAITSISQDRQLAFSYRSAAGKQSTQLVSPLGLVAKDGTMYLVAVKGLTDVPRHFALHRMTDADVHFQPAQPRPDFNLQQYIVDSHQFSHVMDADASPLALRLRVAPDAMFHFRERALSDDQNVVLSDAGEPWFTVTATVPKTMLLVPFLVSLGPWIEVLEPAALRSEVAEWVGKMWNHYAIDDDDAAAQSD